MRRIRTLTNTKLRGAPATAFCVGRSRLGWWIRVWIWINLVELVSTQTVDVELMMNDGWRFQRSCEVSLFPLTVALNMIAKKILEEATREEEIGNLKKGRTYARTGKLLRIYDQAQEYVLNCLKNKRFCGRCAKDANECQ